MPGLHLEVNVQEEPQVQPSPPTTQYAKKALSIGIQYEDAKQWTGERAKDPPPRLLYSHGDPDADVRDFTYPEFYGFQEKDIVVLKDDGKHTPPTKENILKAIDDLVRDAQAGDHFVFHYSGHGGQIPNVDGEDEEEDGMDEVIWPVDIIYSEQDGNATENYIVDDDLRKRLVDSLPEGTHLTVVLDCCHSGSGVDLPYEHPQNDEALNQLWSPVKSPTTSAKPFFESVLLPSAGSATVQTTLELEKSERPSPKTKGSFKKLVINELPSLVNSGAFRALKTLEEAIVTEIKHPHHHKTNDNKYVTSWAACVDADIEIEGPKGGMLTQAFWEVLRKNRAVTHGELVQALAKQLIMTTRPAKKYFLEQGWGTLACPRPVLSSLHRLEEIHSVPFTF
ncbi:hypothetical protein EW145_g181 [Phellinidium pouzarii]|uniref:Peptidase C14 caspase domain-containing protein n=1 Tax=Phellinidium pouzarii TaxID=167371 RepID=A0A4S4LL68_9AGAM|nr:hypothetical protein EW145_g181 [Phellinidium pouzarii]